MGFTAVLPVSWFLGESHVNNPLFVVLGPVSGTGRVRIEASCLLWPAFSPWNGIYTDSQKPKVDVSPFSPPHLVHPPGPSRSCLTS